MTTQEFALIYTGLYTGTCKYIDNLCEEFELDLCEEDLKNAIYIYYHNIATCGNALIKCCFEQIIDKICVDFNNEDLRDLFNYWYDDYASGIAFNGHEYKHKEELYGAIELYRNEKKITKQKNIMKTLTTSKPYHKNRKAAAMELYNVAKCYEQITFTQAYRKCYFDKESSTWRLIGKAHNYSY